MLLYLLVFLELSATCHTQLYMVCFVMSKQYFQTLQMCNWTKSHVFKVTKQKGFISPVGLCSLLELLFSNISSARTALFKELHRC